MAGNPKNTSLSEKPLQQALKTKSRQRREELAALAKASPAPRPIRNDLLPKLALIEYAPADLVVPVRNVRKVEVVHIREVATAISSFGFCDPVLIDEQNNVLDGVVRVEAAKLLGLTHIPYPGASSLGSEAREGLQHNPTVKLVRSCLCKAHCARVRTSAPSPREHGRS